MSTSIISDNWHMFVGSQEATLMANCTINRILAFYPKQKSITAEAQGRLFMIFLITVVVFLF